MNRGPDAIAAGERAIKADPANAEANWILGNLYAFGGGRRRAQDRAGFARKAVASLERADAMRIPACR